MRSPALRYFRLKNFKAVQDSHIIRFTPLTVFIGNNGSGKSSIVEGLETFQTIVEQGLDEAMQQWRGIEYIRHQGVPHKLRERNVNRPYEANPIRFTVGGRLFRAVMQISRGMGGNEIFIQRERLTRRNKHEIIRDAQGEVYYRRNKEPVLWSPVSDGESIFERYLYEVHYRMAVCLVDPSRDGFS